MRSLKGYQWFIFVVIFVTAFVHPVFSKNDTDKDKDYTNMSYLSSRNYTPAFLAKASQDSIGWRRYVRLSIHDGNLITTSYTNQGQFCDNYLESDYSFPNMKWPKGAEAGYGYVLYFWVAGQVIDIHGNTIEIVSDRFSRGGSETAPGGSHRYHWIPLPKYFNNHHPESADWDMVGIDEDVGIDGLPNTNDFGEGDGEIQAGEDVNANGVLESECLNIVEYSAMSHLKETWPKWWPPQSYLGDDRQIGEERPGSRAGRWNGEYGALIRADQESYYVMDDHENDEHPYYPFNFEGTDIPDTTAWPNCKAGLGITVKTRNYQWDKRLAEDILISIYDITNYGKKINKTITGMYVDIDMGGHGADDAWFDKTVDITYMWDKTESWRASGTNPTGLFGFAFLESPGISDDGIDNDEDGLVDENQYNDIDDDGDWRSWEDMNNNGIWDNEDINFNGILDPGEDLNNNNLLDYEPVWDDVGNDGIGPDQNDYTGPDENGTEANGQPDWYEPNYEFTDNDETDQVGLTSVYLKSVDNNNAQDHEFWFQEIKPQDPLGYYAAGWNHDPCFNYASGIVPMESGKEGTQRYAIACLFGWDHDDIIRNKRTMQKIYDMDYNFTQAPLVPTLSAFASDKRVVLTWDSRAERSKDPIYGRDFEGYRLYKSTNPHFYDIKTITDAFNNPTFYDPIAIFDIIDGLKGAHSVNLGSEGGTDAGYGIAMDMGPDDDGPGVRHFYVDENVTNGRTYYYALTSFDKGYDVDFFDRRLSDREGLQPIAPEECTFGIQTDALNRAVTSTRNCVQVIPLESAAGYIDPQPESDIEHISGNSEGTVNVEIVIPSQIKTNNTYQVGFFDDGSFEALNGDGDSIYAGFTTGAFLYDVTNQDTLMKVLADSLNEVDSHFNSNEEEKLSDQIFHGFRLSMENEAKHIHSGKNVEYLNLQQKSVNWITATNSNLSAYIKLRASLPVPRDYELRILELGADTVMSKTTPTNFQVWDVTDPGKEFKVPFAYSEARGKPESLSGYFYPGDVITLYVKPVLQNDGTMKFTQKAWQIVGTVDNDSEEIILPEIGDVLLIKVDKPFTRYDVYEFTMIGNEVVNRAVKNELANIYPVPNPYIAASTLERRLIETEFGRGDRRIDFVNLPMECVIKIFTVSGRLVTEINHSSGAMEGRETWDLRTKDGLEVASGYYFYYVEAPGIGSTTGKLAIIK